MLSSPPFACDSFLLGYFLPIGGKSGIATLASLDELGSRPFLLAALACRLAAVFECVCFLDLAALFNYGISI